VFGVARKLYGLQVGLIATTLVAAHPVLISLSGAVYSESLYLPLLVGGVYFGLRCLDGTGRGAAILCGGLLRTRLSDSLGGVLLSVGDPARDADAVPRAQNLAPTSSRRRPAGPRSIRRAGLALYRVSLGSRGWPAPRREERHELHHRPASQRGHELSGGLVGPRSGLARGRTPSVAEHVRRPRVVPGAAA